MMLNTKYQGSRHRVFRQEDFFLHFLQIRLCKTCDPWGRAVFLPEGYNWNKFGRDLLGDAAHQISRLLASLFQTFF